MQNKYLMFFSVLLLLFANIDAQKIPVSVLNSGFSTMGDGSIKIHTMIGQTIVGETKGTDTSIKSGALYSPDFYHALINDAPVVTPLNNRFSVVNKLYSDTVKAKDPEGDILAYKLITKPEGMLLDQSGVITWTPLTNHSDSVPVSLEVIDKSGLTTQYSFKLKVFTNQPPQITQVLSQTANLNERFVTTINAKDPENEPIFYSLSKSPDGMTISSIGEISWTPILKYTDSVDVTVKVTDQSGIAMEMSFKIKVLYNLPPRGSDVLSRLAFLNSEYRQLINATDPENDKISFSLITKPDGMVISDSGEIIWIPKVKYSDSVDVRVKLTDSKGDSSSLSFKLKVISETDTRPRGTIAAIKSSRKTVTVPYQLSDFDNSTLSMTFYYLSEDGWKTSSNIKGRTNIIDPSHYKDTLIWNSEKDLPNYSGKIAVKLLPRDSEDGFEIISNLFDLDNQGSYSLSNPTPGSNQTVFSNLTQTLTLEFSGPKPDVSLIKAPNVIVRGVKSGLIETGGASIKFNTISISLKQIPVSGDTITVIFSNAIGDTSGKKPEADYQWQFTTAWTGDFNLDGKVSFEDLSYLSTYWFEGQKEAPDTTKFVSIAPVTGTHPYYTITESTKRFDYEDVFAFQTMWRYFYQTTGVKKSLSKSIFNKTPSLLQQIDIINDPENMNRKQINVKGYDLHDIVSSQFKVRFNPAELIVNRNTSKTVLSSNDAQTLDLIDNSNGVVSISQCRLSSLKPGIDTDGELLSLSCEAISLVTSPVTIEYTLINSEHKIVAQGTYQINPEKLLPSKKQFRFSVVPSPGKAAFNHSVFTLHHDNNAYQKVASQGGMVFSLEIPDDIKPADVKKFSLSLTIYDGSRSVIVHDNQDLTNALRNNLKNRTFHFTWDCRSANGSTLPTGVYTAVISWDADGVKGMRQKMVGIKN